MESFKKLVLTINPKADELLCDLTEDFILKSYYEHFRYYHNFDNHILPGLRLLSSISHLFKNVLYVKLAWWYHDVIYVPGGHVNESASAQRARFDCTLLDINKQIGNISENEPYLESSYIAFLVYMTDYSKIQVTNDNDANLLIDVDFSILGSQPDDYLNYASAIHKEYSHISDEKFLTGRRKFLTGLLSQDRIFKTEYFQDNFEKQALDNIKQELQSLS